MAYMSKKREFSKSEVKAAIRALEDMRTLLQKGWTQGAMRLTPEVARAHHNDVKLHLTPKAEYVYCLVGALDEVDGPAERLVGKMLYACATKTTPEDQDSIIKDKWTTVRIARQGIVGFNDNSHTTYRDVQALITQALRKVEKLA